MNTPESIRLYSAPPVWEDYTFVILGCGPSLSEEQIKIIKDAKDGGSARVIAINSSYLLAPWADILYAGDARFWNWYQSASEFCGVRIGLALDAVTGKLYPGYDNLDPSKINFMQSTGELGLESDPTGLRNGKNSGYAAINLAVHMGAHRIALVGFDMQSDGEMHHWHGDQPEPIPDPPYHLFLPSFETLLEPLKELGVMVLNCTPDSKLETFSSADLRAVL